MVDVLSVIIVCISEMWRAQIKIFGGASLYKPLLDVGHTVYFFEKLGGL